MIKKNGFTFFYYNLITKLFILFIKSKFSFSQVINNIIPLGGENFRYNHFSINSKGDMIIDTTASPGNNERRFFGIKRNGRPFFFNENSEETLYKSLFVSGLKNTNQEKVEGESNFIILSKQNNQYIKEYLLSFSKYDNYVELYDFENNEISTVKSSKLFKKTITSDVSSFIKSKSKIDDNYNYYISFIFLENDEYKFYVLRCYFTENELPTGYHFDTGSKKSTKNKAITSCFETETKKLVCFYQNESSKKFTILTLNETFESSSQKYTQLMVTSEDYNLFFKAIHLKKEIGVFSYYIDNNEDYPTISIKICKNEDNSFNNYKNFGSIKLNKMSFNSNAMLNDIIKLNEYKICYLAPSVNKQLLNIVILNLYDNDNYMIIRYYSFNMFNDYKLKFFNDLRACSFNEFISVAFSHCPQANCEDNNDKHYSSLIMFGFPNISSEYDKSMDITEDIIINNKIDNYSFILNDNIDYNIENNIFGYIYKGIKILNYPENTTLIYKNNEETIEKNSFLKRGEILTLIFWPNEEYKGMNFTIEYAIALNDPDYNNLNDYISYIDYTYSDSNEEYFFKKSEYIGRTIYFNITIKDDLISDCNDKCTLCYSRDINSCIICKYNYSFNGKEKICYPNPLSQTTLPIINTIPIISETQYFPLINSTSFSSLNISSTYSSSFSSSSFNLISFSSSSSSSQDSVLISKTLSIFTSSFINTSTIKSIPIERDISIISSTFITSERVLSNSIYTSFITSLSFSSSKSIIKTLKTLPQYLSNSIFTSIQNSSSISTSKSILNPSIISMPSSKDSLISIPSSIIKFTLTTIPISCPESIIESSLLTSIHNSINKNVFISSSVSGNIKSSDLIPISETLSLTNNLIKTTSLSVEKSTSSLSSILSNLQSKSPMIYSSIIINSTLLSSSSTPSPQTLSKSTHIISSFIIYNSNSLFHSNKYIDDIKCTYQQIIDNKCSDIISNVQIEQIYNIIKDNINKTSNISNLIIESKNVIFQVSTLEEQKMNGANISSIELGECEQVLKKKENLNDSDELIIFKIDIKNIDLSLTYVQYEIYNPNTKKLISLDICQDNNIIIKSPVYFDEELQSLYESLNNSDYNLFDLNNSFYSDICSTYTSTNGTDVCMSDRKNIYDNYKNISVCQTGCNFIYYDSTTKKAECECTVQTEEINTETSELAFDKLHFVESFYSTLKNSNFLVMKCFKLVFSLEGQINNIGCGIMSNLLLIFIVFSIWYFVKGNKTIDRYIMSFIQRKILFSYKLDKKNEKFKIERTNSSKKIFKREDSKMKKTIKFNKRDNYKNKTIKIQTIRENNEKKNTTKNNKKDIKQKKNLIKKFETEYELKEITNKNQKYSIDNDIRNSLQINKNKINLFKNKNQTIKNNKNNFPPKKKSNLIKKNSKIIDQSRNLLIKNNQVYDKNSNDNLLLKKKNSFFDREIKIIKNKNKSNKTNSFSKEFLKNDFKNKNYLHNNIKDEIYNDEELNTLNYKQAIQIDKRTYFQYYCSLIKRKHLILFTFIPSNDYNLTQIKICLLILSFSLYFTINGFFFTDETMNKIYVDNGYYDILYQLPQVLYSTLISAIINTIFKRLSLSENLLLSIKQENDIKIAKERAVNIRKNLKIRILFFFIISFLFNIFFWYFISCFCAVYKNTQIILIKDTLLSFAISMIYPFVLYLIPGIFRIPALRATKKDKKCLYNLGNLIALI